MGGPAHVPLFLGGSLTQLRAPPTLAQLPKPVRALLKGSLAGRGPRSAFPSSFQDSQGLGIREAFIQMWPRHLALPGQEWGRWRQVGGDHNAGFSKGGAGMPDAAAAGGASWSLPPPSGAVGPVVHPPPPAALPGRETAASLLPLPGHLFRRQ